jgi:hypothetical protein
MRRRVAPSAAVLVFVACTARRRDAEQLAPADVATGGDPAEEAGRSSLEEGGRASNDASAPHVLDVPHASAPLRPSGHFRVKVWQDAVNTRTLLDRDGRGAVPASEARFLWSEGQLYVRFYAGDLDLQVRAASHDGPVWKDDSVVLAFFAADQTKRVIQISPTGVVADGMCPKDALDLGDARCDRGWESGVRVATDYDGTINKLGDFDEEWCVEAAVPLKAIGRSGAGAGTRIPFAVTHCEMAYSGPRACGSWGGFGEPGTLVLDPAPPDGGLKPL